MSRIVEGIKELLGKGKDDDDELPEYRYQYDQRQSPASNRIYGYPANGTSDVRSGYRRPFGEALDDSNIRNGYDTRASPRGAEYRKPYGINESSPRGIEYATPRGSDYASPRGSDYPTPRGSDYASPRGSEYASPRGSDYASQARGSEYASQARGSEYASQARGSEYASPRGSEYASPRGTEYRRPYVGSEVASPRGDYVRAPLESPRDYQRSPRGSRRDSKDSVIEFMVPMCCDKCKEKVKEELSEVEGVESVRCDPPNSRVIVTGDDSIDIERCLKKAERAVKMKCELISNDAGAGTRDSARYYSAMDRSNGTRDSIRGGTRDGSRVALGSPSGRPSLGRLPSFASGKVTPYDGVGLHGQDYEAKDYSGKGFRRMPSFSKHKYHDAEYINVGDREYSPRTFYESNAGTTYTTAYNEKPVYRSQLSFSKLPVENPNYVKHIAY